MNTELNDNYKMIHTMWVDKKLSELPDIRMGKCHGVEVAREYRVTEDGKRTHYRYLPTNKDYLHACAIANERRKLLQSRMQVPKKAIKIIPRAVIKMTDNEWDSLPDSANMQEFKGEYYFEGIRMRSRVELLVASELKALKLMFKYEPALIVNGEVMYPDFLVYLPELGLCFVIECLGMLDDQNYVYRNASKIINYLSAGYVIGRDITFIHGMKNSLPDVEHIRNQIVRTINFLTDDSIAELQKA